MKRAPIIIYPKGGISPKFSNAPAKFSTTLFGLFPAGGVPGGAPTGGPPKAGLAVVPNSPP